MDTVDIPKVNYDEFLESLGAKNIPFLTEFLETILSMPPRYPSKLSRTINPEGIKPKKQIAGAPGSFLESDYFKIAKFFATKRNGIRVNLYDYPNLEDVGSLEEFDNIGLLEFVHGMYFKIREASSDDIETFIMGHSLGTIITMLILLVHYFALKTNPDLAIKNFKGVIIMGGGPPIIGTSDIFYLMIEQFKQLLRFQKPSLLTIAQMRTPKFITEDGDMWKTIGSKELYKEMLEEGLVKDESKRVMKESFDTSGPYAYLPKNIIAELEMLSIFVHAGEHDFFVPWRTINEAINQWGAEGLTAEGEDHTSLVTGEGAETMANMIADKINSREPSEA